MRFCSFPPFIEKKGEMKKMENIFELGCIVQLSSSVWTATRKINPKLVTDKMVTHEWLRASKKLVDKEALKPIQKMVNAARGTLSSASLPFPISGMLFVPKEMISKVNTELEDYQKRFFLEVDRFIGQYESLRDNAMYHLGEFFNETDYPVDIRSKFNFSWRFITLEVPNGRTALLSPEVYEREKEKFINTMEEARELAVTSLREEFAQMVERITDRFTTNGNGKPKVFKNSTVNNFYEYFETFKERNIFRDQDLEELVSQAQAILGGTSPDQIRENEGLKDSIHSGMSEIETAMTDILSMPRRKICLN